MQSLQEEPESPAHEVIAWWTSVLNSALLFWAALLFETFGEASLTTLWFLLAQPVAAWIHSVQLILKQHILNSPTFKHSLEVSELLKDLCYLLCSLYTDLLIW